MITNTRNLQVGSTVIIDGTPRVILKKEKAFQAPEWFITYSDGAYEQRPNFHSNKKWEVLEVAVA
jgi:hypothetical protein